jgi:hypothetical protein
MGTIKRVFKMDGKPFFPLGGQALDATGYSVRDEAETESYFNAVKMIQGNTVEIAVYWDEIEPEEGKFNFASVDKLLALARRTGLKLILLWFATWKNGVMDFVPAWVKTDPQRFHRAISVTGRSLWVLSPHCKNNVEADIKAFRALCAHLQAKDSREGTVIAIQVENEPGIIGSERDYGSDGETAFARRVPAKLVSAMKAAGQGDIYDIWQLAGGKESGNWLELFGPEAGELMSAWGIATYINDVAKAGKQVYEVPMYINVWLGEKGGWATPGEAYPSGGAVLKVLDIYKWCTPDIDLIAPDNYLPYEKAYNATCAGYARADNPLFVPESFGDLNIFRAIGDYGALGYFTYFYGLSEDGALLPDLMRKMNNFRCVAAAIPLILKYQGTGKIHTVMQEMVSESVRDVESEFGFKQTQPMDFDGYIGLIEFGEKKSPVKRIEKLERGGGLVIQAKRNEFYLIGFNYRLLLRPKPAYNGTQASQLAADWRAEPGSYNFLIGVEEGHFDQDGVFVAEMRRSGGRIRDGVWAGTPSPWYLRKTDNDYGIVRVVTCD